MTEFAVTDNPDLRGYLAQLDETLKNVLLGLGSTVSEVKTVLKENNEVQSAANGNTYAVAVGLTKKQREQFDTLKADIIRTADEVTQECKAYTDTSETEIRSFVGQDYLAKSEFGTYESQTATAIEQLTDSVSLSAGVIENLNTDYQSYKQANEAALAVMPDSIVSKVGETFVSKDELSGESLESFVVSKSTQTASGILEEYSAHIAGLSGGIDGVQGDLTEFRSGVDAYIRRGELQTGVYGIEIGRSDSHIKTRFLSDRVSFIQGEAEVAYISDNNLYILRAEVLDYLRVGNSNDGYFTFDVSQNGLEVRWSE
jgi:hypothetical protein